MMRFRQGLSILSIPGDSEPLFRFRRYRDSGQMIPIPFIMNSYALQRKFITKEQTNKQFSCRWGIVFKYGIFYVTYPIQ